MNSVRDVSVRAVYMLGRLLTQAGQRLLPLAYQSRIQDLLDAAQADREVMAFMVFERRGERVAFLVVDGNKKAFEGFEVSPTRFLDLQEMANSGRATQE